MPYRVLIHDRFAESPIPECRRSLEAYLNDEVPEQYRLVSVQRVETANAGAWSRWEIVVHIPPEGSA